MSTLCVSVDNLGSALEIGTGAAVRPNHDEPGLKALPRLLDMLDELGIVATFFVEGWNGLHHPDALQSITRRGHDVGLHGWVHAKWATLTDDQREVLLYDGTAALRHAGIDAKGFRAPGDYRGSRTAKVLAELGYTYDSSFDGDNDGDNEPLHVRMLPEGLVSIPWQWHMIDYYHYMVHPAGPRSPAQMMQHFQDELDRVRQFSGLVTLIVHPFVSFVDNGERYQAVRRFLRGAVDTPNVEVLSAGQLASRHLATA